MNLNNNLDKNLNKFGFKIAEVVVDETVFHFDKPYDYIVPKELSQDVFVGQRVVVPFGRSNQKKLGLILNIREFNQEFNQEFDFKKNSSKQLKSCKLLQSSSKNVLLKQIIEVVDKERIVTPEMIKIILWLKNHTFCCYFDAVKLVVPAGYNISLVKKYKMSDELTDEIFETLSVDEKSLIDIFRSQMRGKHKRSFRNNFEATDIRLESLTKSQQKILKILVGKNLIQERDVLKQKVKDQKSLMIKLNDDYYINPDRDCKLTSKQQKVVDLLRDSESASVKEVLYLCGVTKSVLDKLTQKEITSYFEIEMYRSPYAFKEKQESTGDKDEDKDYKKDYKDIRLNENQQEIFENLKIMIDKNKFDVALLRGVTGSGKTLIFIELMKYVVGLKKQVVLLVPEISLTPQMIALLEKHFGNLVAVLHSGLSLAQRLDEWKRVKRQEAKIVLGTRSAIFAPVENVGLIIMDEEQEASYKSETVPRYHARDIAKLRAFYNNALFLMASATPSVDTYFHLKKNKFNIFKLDKRYNNISLPEISVVDMKRERQNGNSSFFSQELLNSIQENLEKKQQSIIFINRRGYNTIVRCDECGEVKTCPNCSIALTYHKANNKMLCHYCGYVEDITIKCPSCGSFYLKYLGVGTQKIETQLESIFPQAKILRLDSDTTMTRFSHDKYFKDFLDKKYDILIGTQMIAKGLNFPGVTLVGVIDADRLLYSSDYRGSEKTYDLITQVIGRSGRGDVEGRAIIQTSSADNYIFDLIADQNYENFFKQEILSRKSLLYPPFCDMSIVGIVGEEENLVFEAGSQIFSLIKKLVSGPYKDVKLKMFGPVSEVVSKVNNKYRYKIFLKHRDDKRYRSLMKSVLFQLLREKQKFKISFFIDKI